MPFLCSQSANTCYDVFMAIHRAIAQSFQDTRLSEPQLIANFLGELTQKINNISSCNISAGGVFIHASPLVSCENFPDTASSAVELGDLLLIRSDIF